MVSPDKLRYLYFTYNGNSDPFELAFKKVEVMERRALDFLYRKLDDDIIGSHDFTEETWGKINKVYHTLNNTKNRIRLSRNMCGVKGLRFPSRSITPDPRC